MEDWRLVQISGDLIEVPGIGPKTIEKLADADDPTERITNTFQLIGKYMMLKGPGEVGPNEVNQKFWFWLKAKGVAAHRSAICLAINTKVSTHFQGFTDVTAQLEEEDDDEHDEEYDDE
jgi:DNA polymerase/3'-5' exonuclease PolX